MAVVVVAKKATASAKLNCIKRKGGALFSCEEVHGQIKKGGTRHV